MHNEDDTLFFNYRFANIINYTLFSMSFEKNKTTPYPVYEYLLFDLL
jgi:hypothetical protein